MVPSLMEIEQNSGFIREGILSESAESGIHISSDADKLLIEFKVGQRMELNPTQLYL